MKYFIIDSLEEWFSLSQAIKLYKTMLLPISVKNVKKKLKDEIIEIRKKQVKTIKKGNSSKLFGCCNKKNLDDSNTKIEENKSITFAKLV